MLPWFVAIVVVVIVIVIIVVVFLLDQRLFVGSFRLWITLESVIDRPTVKQITPTVYPPH